MPCQAVRTGISKDKWHARIKLDYVFTVYFIIQVKIAVLCKSLRAFDFLFNVKLVCVFVVCQVKDRQNTGGQF